MALGISSLEDKLASTSSGREASTTHVVEVGNGVLPSRTGVAAVAAARTVRTPCPIARDCHVALASLRGALFDDSCRRSGRCSLDARSASAMTGVDVQILRFIRSMPIYAPSPILKSTGSPITQGLRGRRVPHARALSSYLDYTEHMFYCQAVEKKH